MRYPGILRSPHDISYLSVDSRTRGQGSDSERSVEIRGRWRDTDRSRAYLSDVFGQINNNSRGSLRTTFNPSARSSSLGPKRVAFKDVDELEDSSRSLSKNSTDSSLFNSKFSNFPSPTPTEPIKDYDSDRNNFTATTNDNYNNFRSSNNYRSYRNISNYELKRNDYFDSLRSSALTKDDNQSNRGITTVTYHDDVNDDSKKEESEKSHFRDYNYNGYGEKSLLKDSLFDQDSILKRPSRSDLSRSHSNLSSLESDNHRMASQYYFEKAYHNIKSELSQLQSPFYGNRNREFSYRSPCLNGFY